MKSLVEKIVLAPRRMIEIGRLVDELSDLVKQNRIVVLRPFFRMDKNDPMHRKIVRDVVFDFLKVYGTISISQPVQGEGVPERAPLLLYPLALLSVPPSHDEYLKRVGPKTRNMIRKSTSRGYEFREFSWNDHLNDIAEINASNRIRLKWDGNKPARRDHDSSEHAYLKYFGAFKDGKLYGYVHMVICGDFGFFGYFLGHADHLRNGIMNGLVSWIVSIHIENPQVMWLKYGSLLTHTVHTMFSFRRHAGFERYAAFLDLEDDDELLRAARKAKITYWRGV